MTRFLHHILRHTPAPLTRKEEAQIRLEADVARRKLKEGIIYAARREAALRSARPT